MSLLDQQVATARSRLRRNVLAERVTLALMVGAVLWMVVVLVERTFVLQIPVWWSGAALGVLAILAGGAAAVLHRISAIDAALVVDEAAGLRERLSSAIAVRSASGDEFAQLTVRDAEKTAATVHIPSHVPMQPPHFLPGAGVAVAVALLAAWLFPELNVLKAREAPPTIDASPVAMTEKRDINAAFEQQQKRLRELSQSNPNLKDLEAALKPLDVDDRPDVTPEDVRKEAVKQLNAAAEKLEAQRDDDRKQMLENMRKMLSQLEQNNGTDPGSKLSESLKNGDMQGAQQQLKDMQKQMEEAAQKSADPEQQQKLAQMQQQLQKLSDQMQKLSNQEQMQKELEKKGGMSAEQAQELMKKLSQMDPKEAAKQLQQQLQQQGVNKEQIEEMVRKLQQNQQAQQQLQQLAQQLAQAAQQAQSKQGQEGKQGQQGQQAQQGQQSPEQMGDGLQAAADQLSDLEASEQMMNELEASLSDLNNLKENVLNGSCNNPGDGRNSQDDKPGGQGPQYGRGSGSTVGKERVPFQYRPTKAETRGRGGQIIAQMMIDGPQQTGQASAEAKEAVASAVRDAEDAVERGSLPRQYHRAARRYFEALAGLPQRDGEKK